MKLTFDGVSVEYESPEGDGVVALDGLDLEVLDGESVAIIGPSGCGKSTMLRLASGLMSPTSGVVRVNDEMSEGPRRDTALILQDFGLLPWKTVLGNAELGLKIRGVRREERRRRAKDALASVGLRGFESRYPSELSGGMKQRLAMARALAMDVDLLLMDEPLSALDALLREELQDTLLNLWRENGHTQVLVTHSIEEAVFLGQRIVVMAPRPSRVVSIVENPGMGTVGYRSDSAFFARCGQVRAALAKGCAKSEQKEDSLIGQGLGFEKGGIHS